MGEGEQQIGASLLSEEGLGCHWPSPPQTSSLQRHFPRQQPLGAVGSCSNDTVVGILAPPTRRRRVTYIIAHLPSGLSPFLPNRWPPEYV